MHSKVIAPQALDNLKFYTASTPTQLCFLFSSGNCSDPKYSIIATNRSTKCFSSNEPKQVNISKCYQHPGSKRTGIVANSPSEQHTPTFWIINFVIVLSVHISYNLLNISYFFLFILHFFVCVISSHRFSSSLSVYLTVFISWFI